MNARIAGKVLEISTFFDWFVDINAVLESLKGKQDLTDILVSLSSNKLSEYEYIDSLNNIASFIDSLINNEYLPNLKMILISMDDYDHALVNVFGQISRLIENKRTIHSLSFTIRSIRNDDNNLEFKKQEILKLSNNFLCGQTTIRTLNIQTHASGLPDAHCLGHFNHLSIGFFGPNREESEDVGYFIENYIDILNYNQNIKSLKLNNLPEKYLIRMIEALFSNDSLESFGILGCYGGPRIIESIVNLLFYNKSIASLSILIPNGYNPIIEALADNETLREFRFDFCSNYSQREIDVFRDIDNMLNQNLTLTNISYPIYHAAPIRALCESIDGKIARNREFSDRARFARTKSIKSIA